MSDIIIVIENEDPIALVEVAEQGPPGPPGPGGGGGSADVAVAINEATSKPTPADDDRFVLTDSASSFALRKLTWANIKATAKTYFDTLYAAIIHTHAVADINNVGTSKLLGRHGAGTGTAQEIGIDGGLELHGGNLRREAITGPVTVAAGGSVSAIADGALTISMVSELENILNSTASAEEVANKQDAITSATDLTFNSFNCLTGTIEDLHVVMALTLDNALTIANGGTGSTTAAGARTNLGAQATLVSGTNIKTVNGNSLLGSGDVTISGATFDNPSAQVGLTAINGTASTAMRSDAAPAINQGITPSWTAAHTFTQSIAAGSTATAIELINPTAATSGNQRLSPATVWTGQGWKTNATAASQSVALRAFALPIQGAASPSCEWTLQSSTAGGAWSTFFKIRNGDGGIYGFNQNATENFRISGFSSDTYFDNSAFGNTLFRTNGSLRTNLTLYSSGSLHALFSGSIGISNSDTQISRRAAANISQGASDAAVAVAQTSSVQNVVAGTSNTAGANRTYAGSQGTGTGVGGDHIFTVATAGTSGTSQNALVEAFRVRQDRACFVANVSAEPATPTGGGVFYVEAGALKYKGSSGTVTTIANA